MYFNTGLLLTTLFSAVSLAFFIVGAASVSEGWFKAELPIDQNRETVFRARWGTTGCCVNITKTSIGDCFEYADRSYTGQVDKLLGGGRVALIFTMFGVVLNCISSVFTGIIGRMTAWRFPHLRSRQDCIASVSALSALCCGLIATCSFYALVKRSSIPMYTPKPDYAWVLVFVGSFVDVCLAGATCLHVIVPDTESPWYERSASGQAMDPDEEALLKRESDDEDDMEPPAPSTGRSTFSLITPSLASAPPSPREIEPI